MRFSLAHRRRRVFSFFDFRSYFSRFSDFIEASRVKNIMLDWCALGSATGGKHVSAISLSSSFPIEITRAKFVTVV